MNADRSEVELSNSMPIISATEFQPCTAVHHPKQPEIDMLGLIARWGHNVLLTTMGLLTVAIVILLVK